MNLINWKPFKTLKNKKKEKKERKKKESQDIGPYALQEESFASPGPSIIAEHISTVKVWIGQV